MRDESYELPFLKQMNSKEKIKGTIDKSLKNEEFVDVRVDFPYFTWIGWKFDGKIYFDKSKHKVSKI